MTDEKRKLTPEERAASDQTVPTDDTGSGQAAIPEFEQASADRPIDAEDTDELKARQARGNLGPEQQKGFGHGA